MVNETEKKLYEILNQIPITEKNKEKIQDIKMAIQDGDYKEALSKLQELDDEIEEKLKEQTRLKEESEETEEAFPAKLRNTEIEYIYMGLLLENPKSISRYYFLYDECYFQDNKILNIYKSILFTEGGKYTPEIAKEGFSFSIDSEEVYRFKNELRRNVRDKDYDMEKIYTELKKLFILRKAYMGNPIKNIQDKIIEII